MSEDPCIGGRGSRKRLPLFEKALPGGEGCWLAEKWQLSPELELETFCQCNICVGGAALSSRSYRLQRLGGDISSLTDPLYSHSNVIKLLWNHD
ncbi:hypothetical protein H8959_019973 [Pygathrix nigripes]